MAAEGAAIDRTAALISGTVSATDWLIVLPVAIPIAVGALLLMIRKEMHWHPAIALAGLAASVAANAALFALVLAHGPRAMAMGSWLPPYGIAFTADALGAMFSLVANVVGFAGAAFSLRDIGATGRRYGFYPFLMLLMAGVSGAFLTGDVFNLYVWFEVFLISSFGLLILGSEPAQIDGAVKYAILNLVATTLFLVTTAYLYGVFGTLNMADLVVRVAAAPEAPPLTTLAVLFLLAFGMKAAAFPVNFWLPASYHTPRIVTAALFGGLLTKVGVYALLRVLTMILPVERALLSGLIGWVAGLTMILGALGALAQSDIRRLFGFLVISGVGVMLSGIALGSAAGLGGSIVYAVHSMLAMTALYLLGGLMRERGGSYSLHTLSGLYRDAPLLSALALVLFLAASGLPPGMGLWPKVVLVKAALDTGAWWLAGAILVSSLIVTIALFRIFALAFWRALPERKEIEPQPGGALSAASALSVVAVLTVPILWFGLFPETALQVAGRAAAGLIDPSAYVLTVFPQGGAE